LRGGEGTRHLGLHEGRRSALTAADHTAFPKGESQRAVSRGKATKTNRFDEDNRWNKCEGEGKKEVRKNSLVYTKKRGGRSWFKKNS